MYDTFDIVGPARLSRRQLRSIAVHIEARPPRLVGILRVCYQCDLQVRCRTAKHHSHQGERLEQKQDIQSRRGPLGQAVLSKNRNAAHL